MTDNEIIQALNNMLNHKWIIAEAYGEFIRIGDIADLVNRQKAEIERLQRELNSASYYLSEIAEDWEDWDD